MTPSSGLFRGRVFNQRSDAGAQIGSSSRKFGGPGFPAGSNNLIISPPVEKAPYLGGRQGANPVVGREEFQAAIEHLQHS